MAPIEKGGVLMIVLRWLSMRVADDTLAALRVEIHAGLESMVRSDF
jgi:hypothetical protein